MTLKRYIRRGKVMRGRDLYNALRYAGQAPRVAKGLQVAGGSDGPTALSLRKRQIIPPSNPGKEVRIAASVQFGTTGKWQYLVVEVRAFEPSEGGMIYEDVTNGFSGVAYNRAEVQNGSSLIGIVGYGEDITDTNEATLSLEPIRNGSLVTVTPHKDPDQNTIWWFSAPNPITVECQ